MLRRRRRKSVTKRRKINKEEEEEEGIDKQRMSVARHNTLSRSAAAGRTGPA